MGTKGMTPLDSDGGHLFADHNIPWAQDFGLVTVIKLPPENELQATAGWLRAIVEHLKSDVVFHEAFLATIIFHGVKEDFVELTDDARRYLTELGNERVVFHSSPDLLPGPYVIIGQKLRDAWKLIDDVNGTCMATLKPQTHQSYPFETFQLRSTDGQFSCFALQSQIKAKAAFNSRLAGLRVLVKDNIHLQGTRTSVGNRAFYDTYPPRRDTADCIQKLIDQGVVVCGKTKLTSFANWEEPLEYIDYQAPWNPRADGYQSPGGSSSGSAAAVATYDWLDIAIGTDTWGSVTRPALWCGCFGLRPTMGAISSNGVEPSCRVWDTPGILARDLKRCRDFAAEWLLPESLERRNPKPFSSIMWPTDFWSNINPKQIEIARQFAQIIEKTLNVDCCDVSVEETWATSPPTEGCGLTLPDFINNATGAQCYDAYHNCDDFREKYRKLFNHAPYVSAPNQKMWAFAKTISQESRDNNFAKIDVYKRWFSDTILTGKNFNALVIMPIESMTPRYRDEQPTFKRPPQDGINALTLGPVMGSPVLAIPIAEIPHYSRITQQEEQLPFAVAIMSPPGSDLALMDMALLVLEKAGLPTAVETGKRMFG